MKRKKYILSLVVLMSISLLGIIAAQYLWIDKAMNIQQGNFKSMVFSALNSASERIDNEFTMGVMYKAIIPALPTTPSHRAEENKVKDTIEAAELIKIRKATADKAEYLLENTMDTIPRNKRKMKLRPSIPAKKINKVYNKMLGESIVKNTPIRKWLKVENLNVVLKEELKNFGIDAPFEFAVFNNKTNEITEIFSANYKDSSYKDGFRAHVNLFPVALVKNWTHYDLKLIFPEYKIYLYKSQLTLLIISGIFTLFILTSFFLFLRLVLHQKKLADIKTDFINNMTHEFKTPIATINLATDNILTPYVIEHPDRIKPFLEIIKEENERMNKQVEKVLEMSLIDKKEFSISPTSVDLHSVITKSVDMIQLLLSENKCSLTTQLNAKRPVINADKLHITNLLVNLLENAIKYSKDDCKITVSTQSNNKGVTLKILDNGIGMSKEQQKHIFDKFYRVSTGNIHNIKGFGLGLCYVKAVTDAHKGTINIKSKLGQGSEFSVFLPYN